MGINNGQITDRGWEFSDKVTFQVMDYEKVQEDDYPGAFKPMPGGNLHPTGLGTVPGTGVGQPTQQMAATPKAHGLVVRLAATHAGLITRNNGFYLPDKMREGTKTFTELYPKPIQVHHEDHKDPVGRVLAARYIETIGQVVDKFKNHVLRDSRKKDVGRADEEFWKDFCGSDKSFIEKLQMVKLMDSVLEDRHYRGVGYIELTADITDRDAVQKVLDGRFLTGSVGAVSDKAVCSICNANWLEEDHCGHRPGKKYEDRKCFVVAGKLEYDEYSFVNTPADRHSGILSVESTGILDSVKKDEASKSLFFYPIADYFHQEDSQMDDENKAVESEEIKDETQTTEETTESQIEDNAGTETGVQDAASSEESGEVEVKDETSEEKKEDGVQAVHPAELLMEKLFVEDATFSDEDEDQLYELMMAELDQEGDPSIEDAKLSTAQRKKLPQSSFCGPDRSFPVNDCAHYTAAKRLLGRYKGPGDKSEISACIDRKGKALGCSGASKDTGQNSAPAVKDEVVEKDARLTVEVMQSMLRTLDLALYGNEWDPDSKDEAPALEEGEIQALRKMLASLSKRLGKDNMDNALTGLTISQEAFDIQVAEAHRLEDALGEKVDQLNALRQELRATYADVATLSDQLVDANSKLRDQKVARLEQFHTLEGTMTDELKGNFVKMSDEVLDNSLETLSGKVDINRIADKLNDGLSRTPEGTVDNPTEVTTPSVTEETKKDTVDNKPTFQSQVWADETYRRILVHEKNPAKAKAFYRDAVAKGFAKEKPGFDN